MASVLKVPVLFVIVCLVYAASADKRDKSWPLSGEEDDAEKVRPVYAASAARRDKSWPLSGEEDDAEKVQPFLLALNSRSAKES